jgi:hypothetical protein
MTRPEGTEEDQEWDDCDSPLITTTRTDSAQDAKDIKSFCMFANSIDGINSDLIKPPKKRLITSLQTRNNLNITIRPSLPPMRPFDEDEQKLLPPSFVLAARNLLSHSYVLAAQQSVDNAKPYFFYGAQMFPAILRGSSNMTRPLREIIPTMTPAIVHGVSRQALQGRSWPAAYHTCAPNDSVVGMLAFSVPQHAQNFLDRFQSGSSARRVMRASFNLVDGRACEIDCYVYVTEQRADLNIARKPDRPWRVTDLMQDAWHLQNLAASGAEEMVMQAGL